MKRNKQREPGRIRQRHQQLVARMGIRSTIMLYLVMFVAFVISLLWIFQVLLLQDFYRFYRSNQIESTAKTIEVNLDNTSLSDLAEHLAQNNDVCILLLDADGNTKVSAESGSYCLIHRMSQRESKYWIQRSAESTQPVVQIFATRPRNKQSINTDDFRGDVKRGPINDTLLFMYAESVTFTDGEQGTLLINARISPVASTVAAIRFQLVSITIIVLLAALLLAFIISRVVSKPIIETNTAARSLSRGEYTKPRHSDSYREIAQLNNTLVETAHELNRVEELQHELIANISHDLRTPLTMIGGYAQMMRDIPDETTPENLQIIMDETTRLTSLVNELLDFSRLQTGNEQMDLHPMDLTASVRSIITRIAGMTQKDGYIIEFAPTESFYVLADDKRVGQVVYNLLGNALTYTGPDKRVIVTQEKREDRVRITITDTGKGIPKDELALIWNRYYRTKETHKRAVVGSGLGLNIVRTILEKHNAPYGVDSVVGEGTSFWFELSLAPDTPLE